MDDIFGSDVNGNADDINFAEPTVSEQYFNSVGISGLRREGNFVYEEFLNNLRWPQAAKIFQEMADNDATIGAIFYMAEQLVRKTQWHVRAASDNPADIETAKFVEECMHDMSSSWADIICEALSMFVYGWSFHEVVYKFRKGPIQKDGKYRSKYSDGRIGWRNMPPRSQHTLYGWKFTDDSGATAMIQWAPPKYELVEIPFKKGLLFRTKVSRNNPEGKSLLRNAYRSWYFKKRIEEIEGIGIERDLAGLPILSPPENTAIWDDNNPQARKLRMQAESIVRNVRRDQMEGIVLPYGWKFTLASTGGSRQFDTTTIINRYDQRIAITMLADLVMLGADKVGSFALADVKKSLLASAIEAQVQSIADVFNKHAIPPLLEINAIKCPNGYPELYADEIESPSIEEIMNIFKSTGISFKEDLETYNFVRNLLTIDPVSESKFAAMQEKWAEQQAKENQAANNKGNVDGGEQGV